MSENRFVYRYRDANRPGDGAASLYIERRLVIKETACFLYHMPLPYNWKEGDTLTESEINFGLKTKGYWRAKKTRKDAHRSAWRTDKKMALADWLGRKAYQLSRLRLTIERVEELLNTGIRDGVIVPQTGNMSPFERVISAPDVMDGAVTPEAEQYDWREY